MSVRTHVHTEQSLHSLSFVLSLSCVHTPPLEHALSSQCDESSHEPLLLLFVELLGPAAGQLQVVIGAVWLIVQVHAGHSFFGHGPLYLRPFMPFVKRRNGDHLRPHVQRRLQGRLIVTAVHPVAGVVVVPRPDAGVDVTWSNAGDEEEIVAVAESFDGLPVLVRGAEGEAVGSKKSVHAIKASCEDVVLVALLHDQGDKDGVVGRAAHAVGAGGSQKLRPGLWWSQVGVIDVK